MSLYRRLVTGAVVAIALSACSEPPPEPPPQPPPEPAPEPEPPPPKCESLDEACAADASTEVPIVGTDYVFTPPSGWTYAKLAEATVAQKDGAGAVLVLASFEPPTAAAELSKKREASLDELAAMVGLTPKKGALGAANQQAEMAGLKMALWEKPGAKRGEAEGAILVLSAPADGREIFGLGYAPRDDDEGTSAILKALESIRKEGAGDESK